MFDTNITPREYLARKDIQFRESNGELITRCVFNNCDADSRGSEAHLYISVETGQYDCKKCGEKGNLRSLAKHFGDTIGTTKVRPPKQGSRLAFGEELVHECHEALPERIRSYLNGRGISNDTIDSHKLGYGTFYGKSWITIPIRGPQGAYAFFKLRQDPDHGNDKITYPKGAEAQLYDWLTIAVPHERLIICEGELDCLTLLSRDVPAVTGTHGAGTFKEAWVEMLANNQRIKAVYICFDRDEAGRKGAERVAKMVEGIGKATYIVALPLEVGDGGDVTDYLTKLGGTTDDLFGVYAKPYPERIDAGRFTELTPGALAAILGLTIKRDEENKLVTFLCELAAYTENSQFNISYNAPSSTGKSFIPTEIARYFPEDDVLEIAYCSPTAFFHDTGEYDKERNRYTVDLSRKILIFLDQPHNDLLARLRPLLSHDKKEISLKITDKSQKAGLRTKNVLLRGYPSVIFCTAGLNIDEQEATRFLLLSPEVSQEKIRDGIAATIRKEADNNAFKNWLDEDVDRALLVERVRAIKLEGITEINIAGSKHLEERYLKTKKMLKPRHQRDIKRLLALVKASALLNLWWRERNGSVITANEADVEAAFAMWEALSTSQELGLPPYIFDLYNDVILPAWQDKNGDPGKLGEEYFNLMTSVGVTRQEVITKHYQVYGRMLDIHQLRLQILPVLETAGLITQEHDPGDKRRLLIHPTMLDGLALEGPEQDPVNNNSEDDHGASGILFGVAADSTRVSDALNPANDTLPPSTPASSSDPEKQAELGGDGTIFEDRSPQKPWAPEA